VYLLYSLNTTAPLLAVSLIAVLFVLSIVTERVSDDHFGSLDKTDFVAKFSRVRI